MKGDTLIFSQIYGIITEKVNDMAKGPFMEYLRCRATETIPNTYIENIVPVPTSKTETMAMLIHEIRWWQQLSEVVVAGTTESIVTIADRSHPSGLVWPDSAGVIVHNVMWRKEEVGPVNENFVVKFDPPILYSKAHIYLGARGIGNNVSLMAIIAMIGYTLEKVSREDFISALVE
jgi:hypothetical protein